GAPAVAGLPAVLRDHLAGLADPLRGRSSALAAGIDDGHPASSSAKGPLLAKPPDALASPAVREGAGAGPRGSPPGHGRAARRHLLRAGPERRLSSLRPDFLRRHRRRHQPRLGADRAGAVAHRLPDAELPRGTPSPGLWRAPGTDRVYRLPVAAGAPGWAGSPGVAPQPRGPPRAPGPQTGLPRPDSRRDPPLPGKPAGGSGGKAASPHLHRGRSRRPGRPRPAFAAGPERADRRGPHPALPRGRSAGRDRREVPRVGARGRPARPSGSRHRDLPGGESGRVLPALQRPPGGDGYSVDEAQRDDLLHRPGSAPHLLVSGGRPRALQPALGDRERPGPEAARPRPR